MISGIERAKSTCLRKQQRRYVMKPVLSSGTPMPVGLTPLKQNEMH
jgi:hypothetical protein